MRSQHPLANNTSCEKIQTANGLLTHNDITSEKDNPEKPIVKPERQKFQDSQCARPAAEVYGGFRLAGLVSGANFSQNQQFLGHNINFVRNMSTDVGMEVENENCELPEICIPSQTSSFGDIIPRSDTIERVGPGLSEFIVSSKYRPLWDIQTNLHISSPSIPGSKEIIKREEIPMSENIIHCPKAERKAVDNVQSSFKIVKHPVENLPQEPAKKKGDQADLLEPLEDLGLRIETAEILNTIQKTKADIAAEEQARLNSNIKFFLEKEEESSHPTIKTPIKRYPISGFYESDIINSLTQKIKNLSGQQMSEEEFKRKVLDLKLDLLEKRPKTMVQQYTKKSKAFENTQKTNEEVYSGKKAPEKGLTSPIGKLDRPDKILKKAILNHSESDSSTNKSKEHRIHKQDSKNIVKNYGKAICSFCVDEVSQPYRAKLLDIYQITSEDFKNFIFAHKERIDSIRSFREMLLPSDEDSGDTNNVKKVFRELSEIFLKNFAVNWIFCSKSNNKQILLSYRFVMLRRVQNPMRFVNLKNKND